MELTKRQEKQLSKVFDNPKKLRKWIDEVYQEMVEKCRKQTGNLIDEYLNIYSVVVAFTAHYTLGLGKKRLPEFMERIWNNLDCLKSEHLNLQDCIEELEEYGIDFKQILKYSNQEEKNDNR